PQPGRDGGPAHGRYAFYLFRGQYGHKARYYGRFDAGRARPLLEIEEKCVVEEELGYDQVGARVYLILEVGKVFVRARGLGVRFGVAADGDSESPAAEFSRFEFPDVPD